MKNVILILSTFLVSCSLLQNSNMNKVPLVMEGKITSNNYISPLPSHLSFYINEKLIYEVETNKTGSYNLIIDPKYKGEKAMIVIVPSEKCYTKKGVETNIVDTNFITLSSDTVIQNWKIMNCFFLVPTPVRHTYH